MPTRKNTQLKEKGSTSYIAPFDAVTQEDGRFSAMLGKPVPALLLIKVNKLFFSDLQQNSAANLTYPVGHKNEPSFPIG